jgi:hypothetical protein
MNFQHFSFSPVRSRFLLKHFREYQTEVTQVFHGILNRSCLRISRSTKQKLLKYFREYQAEESLRAIHLSGVRLSSHSLLYPRSTIQSKKKLNSMV